VHGGIILQLLVCPVEKVFYGARHVPEVFGGADYHSAAALYILCDRIRSALKNCPRIRCLLHALCDGPRHFLRVARLRMEYDEYVCNTE